MKRGRSKPQRQDGAARTGMEIAVPVFGYKSHLNIDRRHRLIRCWTVTDAAAHDSRSLPALLNAENTASGVWADTAYRTHRNLEAVLRRGLKDRIQFRRPPRRPLSAPRAKANAARARLRSAIAHVFARQKHRMALFVRTVGLARARMKIGLANLAFDFTRLAWLEAQRVEAVHRKAGI